MYRLSRLGACVILLGVMPAACDFQKQADVKFGDQFFKTTIALVELHKVRFGIYPESLKDLRFTGDWDQGALLAVDYRRDGEGYDLDINRGWMAKPDLKYPPEFWQGLGLVKSNVKQE
jgi:hypothetical protein